MPEAQVIRQIFDWLVREQASIGEICRRLDAERIPTRTGKLHWDRTTVWGMLKNPAYKGQAAFGKTETAARGILLRPLRNRPACGRSAKSSNRDRPPEQWIHVPVPALVSKEIFDAAQEQLQRDRQLSQRNQRGQRYLLQGLTVCAHCHYAFYGKLVSKKAQKGPERYAYYRCVGSDSYRFAGGRVCHNPQVRADQLDKYVWESVSNILQDPSHVLAEWSRRGNADGETARLCAQQEEARAVVQGLDKSLRRLVDAYELGALDLASLQQRSERLRARLVRAKKVLAEAEGALAQTVELKEVAGRLADFATQVAQGLQQADFLARRQILRALLARVEVDNEGATVVYRIPALRPAGTPTPPTQPEPGLPSSAGESCQLRGRRNIAVTSEPLLALRVGLVGPKMEKAECAR